MTKEEKKAAAEAKRAELAAKKAAKKGEAAPAAAADGEEADGEDAKKLTKKVRAHSTFGRDGTGVGTSAIDLLWPLLSCGLPSSCLCSRPPRRGRRARQRWKRSRRMWVASPWATAIPPSTRSARPLSRRVRCDAGCAACAEWMWRSRAFFWRESVAAACTHAPRTSLTSPSFLRQDSRDIKITDFSISLFGKMLFEDQTIELTYGHRYVRTSMRPAP